MNNSQFRAEDPLGAIHNSSFKSSSSPRSPVPGLPSTLCLLLIFAFAVFFSALAVQQHRTFQTNGLDLGNVDQALWNTAQGRFLHFTLMTPVQSRLALHVEPILLLLVPFYWVNLGGPELLLVIQAGVVALGAWPLYQLSVVSCQLSVVNSLFSSRLAVFRFISFVSLVFPLAYLLLPTLESAVLFDFHAVTLSSTFLLFAFLALEQHHNRSFIIFALLVMACKEDMPLVVAMLGLYAGLVQRRWRLAGVTIALSALWFGLAFFLIQPRFAAGGNIQLNRYAWLGDSPPAMLLTLLTQPALVFNHLWFQADLPGYLLSLFFPTAFLALFSPLTLLPMLPTLAVNLLSDNPFTWRLEDFHYGAPLAPFLFISAIYGIQRISEWACRLRTADRRPQVHNSQSPTLLPPCSLAPLLFLTLLLLIFSLIYHTYRGFTPLARPFAWPQIMAHHRRLAEVLPTLPPDAPLFAQSNLAPHLTQRQFIYSEYTALTDPAYPAPVQIEEIVLDVTSFENQGGLHQFLRQHLLESGEYQVIMAEDGILHLQKTGDRRLETEDQPSITNNQLPALTPYSLLPTPFFTFAHPDSPPQISLAVDFGEAIRLRGYSLHFNRQEEVQVSVDLEALQPLTATPEIQPVLYRLDAEGQPQGATTDLQPLLVWYPPAQWPVGQTVRVRFNTLPWYTRNIAAYRLALGLVNGTDVWQSPRFRPSLSQPTTLAVRLPADGTLIELARIQQVWNIPEGGPLMRQFTLPTLSHSLEANFDNQIKLLDYTLQSPIANPQLPTSVLQPSNLAAGTQSATLHLTWQALTPPPNLTRFAQLIGPDGQVYAQNDSAPDRGQYPTYLWQPGEIVVESITLPLPPDRPAGKYTLHIGLYHPDTGVRLSLIEGGDHIEIEVN